MGPAEADQGIGGVAKAEQCAANFQIQIALRGACSADLPQVENHGKKKGEGQHARCDQNTSMQIPGGDRIAVTAEKPDDPSPTTHEIPQLPKKNCQLAWNASLCPFLTGNPFS